MNARPSLGSPHRIAGAALQLFTEVCAQLLVMIADGLETHLHIRAILLRFTACIDAELARTHAANFPPSLDGG